MKFGCASKHLTLIKFMMLTRKIITGLLLFLNANLLFAQWVGISSSDDRGGYSVYVDPDSGVSIDHLNY